MAKPAPRGIAFGRYELLAPIGYGGMAEIWKARLPGPGGFAKTVVVKRILPHLNRDQSFAAMFASEAALLSRLAHPNIVNVFEFSTVGSELYIAMEYVEGLNLVEVMKRIVPETLPIGMVLYVVRECCRALAYAHALRDDEGQPLQLIHRDVSPSNLMVATDGRVKLLDFGIAKAIDSTDETTRTGVLKGKLGYLSPEAFAGADLDLRADIFSVGVVLHELLVGKRLFRQRDDLQTLARNAECDVPVPSSKRAEISPRLDAICLRALARDRNERYASCEELVRALTQELAYTPWDDAATAAFVSEHSLVPRKDAELPPQTASLLPAPDELATRSDGARARRWPVGIGIGLVALAAATTYGIRHARPLPAPVVPAPIAATPVPAELPAPPEVAPILAVTPPPVAATPVRAAHRTRPSKSPKEAHRRINILDGDIFDETTEGARPPSSRK